MDETNPTARALRCLTLIQEHPGIRAASLAERLGVSDRAARRYVAVLREAEIPVESTPGRYGGYRIGRGARRTPLLFTPTEALGLVMAVLDGHHDAGSSDDPVGVALGKLLRALPETVAGQAEAVRRTGALAPDRGAARPDPQVASALVEAIAASRRVALGYRSEAGSEWETEVDPWAVVVRYGRWYLLCWSHRAREPRTYRVDRITSIALCDAASHIPADLDPVSALEAHLATGWEHDVEIVVDAPLAEAVRWVSPTMGRLEAVDETSSRIVGSTSNPAMYAELVARLPVAYRLLDGPEVREAVRTLATRMLASLAG